jgi:Mg/Co/Ni transporter MgtE
VHLQRMLREPPHEAIGGLVESDIDVVTADAPLLQVSRLLATYNLLALPVVDAERRLLGAVSIDDVLDHLLPEDWREADDEDDAAVGQGTMPVTAAPVTAAPVTGAQPAGGAQHG